LESPNAVGGGGGPKLRKPEIGGKSLIGLHCFYFGRVVSILSSLEVKKGKKVEKKTIGKATAQE